METHKLIPHLQRALHLAISAKVQTLTFDGNFILKDWPHVIDGVHI